MHPLFRRTTALLCLGILFACVPACGWKKAKKDAKDVAPAEIDLGAATSAANPLVADVAAARKAHHATSSDDSYFKANASNRIDVWKEAAEKGSSEGQWLYGRCLEVGAGVKASSKNAAKWYRKAADQGFALGQNSLGICYREGEGVAEDDAEAVKWFRKAAGQGEPAAQFNLAEMYEEGDGVKESMKEALKWYRKASAGGYAEASMRLMLAYEEGEGVPKNPAEAAKLRELAKEQIGSDAEKRLAEYRAQN